MFPSGSNIIGPEYGFKVSSNNEDRPLLDAYPGAFVARSVARLLRTAYAGSAIRVRRDSDNAESDIGFVNGELDTITLAAFIGADSAFITIMYDQATNGRNWIQVNPLLQPRIANAGVIDTLNGKPAAVYNGTTMKMTIAPVAFAAGPGMVYAVIKVTKNVSLTYNTSGTGTSGIFGPYFNSASTVGDNSVGLPVYFVNAVQINTTGVQATSLQLYNSFINLSALLTSINYLFFAYNTAAAIFDSYGGVFNFGGYLQEDIIYETQVQPQAGIERNIMRFYGL